jgi:SAM-dependent methyltransferase
MGYRVLGGRDVNNVSLYNRTRRTEHLPAKFRSTHRWDLLLLHGLLRRSFLAREGIENSGSFRFADHLYRNLPRGEGVTGWLIDRILLSLPAARTMRRRYLRSKTEMLAAFRNDWLGSAAFRVLSIPCGIPRDVADFIETVVATSPGRSVEYYGMDLDPVVLKAAAEHLTSRKIDHFRLVCGDALIAEDYPRIQFDFVASTGLGEFLTDTQLQMFYLNVYQVLRPGGIFYTSALDREPISEWLMQPFELHAHYRSETNLRSILAGQSWQEVTLEPDQSHRQTYIIARK